LVLKKYVKTRDVNSKRNYHHIFERMANRSATVEHTQFYRSSIKQSYRKRKKTKIEYKLHNYSKLLLREKETLSIFYLLPSSLANK